jgi:dTDP-4-amino-4,6-dideoxygalactose transaminase
VPFLDLPKQFSTIHDDITSAVERVIRTSDFILGKDVELLEQEFAAFCEAEYAVGVDSGLSALELSLRACGVGPGDNVITTANTFIATVLAISSTGATPVLMDIDPVTHSMDPSVIRKKITARTKAIIPVHLYGHAVDMDAISEVAHKYGVAVIEDACQAHGARYKNRRVGSLGTAAAFSFYPGKNLGACGDGGMIVTDDPKIADSIRMLRNYGQREKYHHCVQGYNRRLDSLQAAILRVKLPHLDRWNEQRRQHAWRYRSLLRATKSVTLPKQMSYCTPVWHLFVILTARRQELARYLSDRGVQTGIHYPIPVHLQPAYKSLGYGQGAFPVCEYLAERVLSLPMYPELTEAQIEHVVACIGEFEKQNHGRRPEMLAG